MVTHKNHRRFYGFNLLSDGGVPEASGFDIGFVQPRFDVLLRKILCDLADGGLVVAVVAQEDIKGFCADLLRAHNF